MITSNPRPKYRPWLNESNLNRPMPWVQLYPKFVFMIRYHWSKTHLKQLQLRTNSTESCKTYSKNWSNKGLKRSEIFLTAIDHFFSFFEMIFLSLSHTWSWIGSDIVHSLYMSDQCVSSIDFHRISNITNKSFKWNHKNVQLISNLLVKLLWCYFLWQNGSICLLASLKQESVTRQNRTQQMGPHHLIWEHYPIHKINWTGNNSIFATNTKTVTHKKILYVCTFMDTHTRHLRSKGEGGVLSIHNMFTEQAS